MHGLISTGCGCSKPPCPRPNSAVACPPAVANRISNHSACKLFAASRLFPSSNTKQGVCSTIAPIALFQVVKLHPSCVLGTAKPDWVIYNEFVLTKENYIRIVTDVEPEWFFLTAPHYFELDNLPTSEVKNKLTRLRRKMIKEGTLKEDEE